MSTSDTSTERLPMGQKLDLFRVMDMEKEGWKLHKAGDHEAGKAKHAEALALLDSFYWSKSFLAVQSLRRTLSF